MAQLGGIAKMVLTMGALYTVNQFKAGEPGYEDVVFYIRGTLSPKFESGTRKESVVLD